MQLMFCETGLWLPKPFATATPLSTVVVFDNSELHIVDALLTSLLNHYQEDQVDKFYYQLRAIREDVRANIPEVIQ